MMKPHVFTSIIFFGCLCALHAQSYNIGTYDTVPTTLYKRNRPVLVHVPGNGLQPDVRYPVLYLLDGDAHFTKTVGIIDHLSTTAGNELCPQMIVVAIFHPNRERDLIPPASQADVANDKFPQFLEKELIPYINSHYPTDPYSVFVGHSLGGLRVVNTLVYQPHLFNSYIALDPSLGMVDGWIGNATATFNQTTYSNKSLYIAMGMTMPAGTDTSVIIRDTSGSARHMRCIMTFARNAASVTHNGLDFNWKYYPEETHQSVVFMGTYDGLIANFHWFKNEKLFDIFKPEVSPEACVKIITDYYEFISVKMGYNIIPPEQGTAELIDYLFFKKWYDKALAFARLNYQNYPNSSRTQNQLQTATWNTKKSLEELYPQKSLKEICRIARKDFLNQDPQYNLSEDAINTWGYQLMWQNKLKEAEQLFKLNIELYPNSYNVYDSYGECLINMGNETDGIAAYKKSLELNPQNTNAVNVLKKYTNP